jgi:PAS domain S-box-containing protein
VTLKTMVSFLLANRFPLLLWWGPDYISIYNDAYRPILGAKHPWALGQPFREVWAEIREVLQPLIDAPFNGGPATWMDDIELEVKRHGFVEETHFTVAYSPVPDATAPRGIGGVLATVHEITDKVIAERRSRLLAAVGAQVSEIRTAEEACQNALEVISRYPKDVPFALLYLVDKPDQPAQRVATTGLHEEQVTAIETVSTPIIAAAIQTESSRLLDLNTTFLHAPSMAAPEFASRAIVIPIKSNLPHRPAGALVAGVSPRLKFDELYSDLLELMASQIGIAIVNARAYEEERKRAEALAEIDRAKTTFFSNISHEFRTPLTLMLEPIADVAGDPAVPAKSRMRLELAHRNSLRLLRLVNSLLDFSRIEAGRARAAFVPTDLAERTRYIASTFESAIDRAGLKYSVDCDSGPLVYVDDDMWEKIVLNLLSNAFKFTLAGEIAVRQRFTDGHVVLEVSDTGIGVEEHDLPRLFQRFSRIETTHARTHEGSGIGLALTQELVKLHGGTIDVQSTPKVGTTFRVQIPLGHAHLPKEQIKPSRDRGASFSSADAFVEEASQWLPSGNQTPPAPVTVDAARARVLIADDNGDMRAYLSHLLSPLYDLETASDGAAALAAIRKARPNLVLSDVMMPNLDGVGLLKAIRSDRDLAGLPVILVSARAGEEANIGGLDAGADDYLTKPFTAQELLARVRTSLNLAALRKRSEAALQKTEERLRRMVNVEGLGFLLFEASTGVLIDANDAFCKMFGYTREQVRSRELDWQKLTPPEHYETSLEQMRLFEQNHKIGPYEKEYLHADGSRSWTLFAGTDLGDGTIGEYCIDISGRREAEDRLREADRQKDEFLAMLAHELRNPLASISNASELIARFGGSNQRAELPLALLKRQTQQLTRLVDDLLDISRIARGRIALEEHPVDIGEVIEQAIETVQPVMRKKAHRFTVTKPRYPVFVLGDKARLVQATSNMLHNAAKYTDSGGNITLKVFDSPTDISIEIEDNGSGISSELLPHVFDLFVQSERTLDRSQGGLGIGLSVVKRLIEMHHGSVRAASAGAGRGSTFAIRLPRIEAPELNPSDPVTSSGALRRILVVDDNVDAADSLAMLLELDGHEVQTVYGGAEAIEAATRLDPDIVFLDIGLPHMDGYEVARRLREQNGKASLRLVALTGYGQKDDRDRSQEAGFDAHLVKPVTPEAIETIVRSSH